MAFPHERGQLPGAAGADMQLLTQCLRRDGVLVVLAVSGVKCPCLRQQGRPSLVRARCLPPRRSGTIGVPEVPPTATGRPAASRPLGLASTPGQVPPRCSPPDRPRSQEEHRPHHRPRPAGTGLRRLQQVHRGRQTETVHRQRPQRGGDLIQRRPAAQSTWHTPRPRPPPVRTAGGSTRPACPSAGPGPPRSVAAAEALAITVHLAELRARPTLNHQLAGEKLLFRTSFFCLVPRRGHHPAAIERRGGRQRGRE